MLAFLFDLFSTEGFVPRWNCGAWTTPHGVLHIVSDLGVWSAYVAIPMVLGYFALKRRDLPFRNVFWLFVAFILACGTTHLMEAFIFYWPAYRLAGAIKLFTAIVSWGTVIALIPITPQVLALRSPLELEREVASREQAEQALRQSAPTIRALVQGSPLAIVTVNERDEVLIWNAAAEQTLGWAADEVLGRPLPPLRVVADGDSTRLAPLFQASHVRQSDARCRRKDGTVIDVSLSTAALSDERGPIGKVAMLDDITDQKRAEEARRRLTSIVECSDDAIIGETPDGTIRSWNRAAERMFGYSAAEAIGKNISLLFPFESANQLAKFRREVLAGGTLRQQETKLKRKDGKLVDVSVSLSPLYDEHESVIGVSKIIRDITHTRQLQEQIQHAQKLESLGVLAGGIAHDFNNLLMGILGGADLALLELSPQSPSRECLEVIQRSAMRAAELCHQMLAYSGKGRFVVQLINLTELVEEMTHLLDVSVSKKALLRYDFAAELPLIEADATQVRQVVMNLIINASDAIGDKSGVVTIRTGALEADADYLAETYLDDDLLVGCYVYVEVSDTGCGMDEATKNKIFDPFFTTKFTGRGLGLAAVLGIVRGHRGAIKIYSESGRGTTMKVLFPCSDKQRTETIKEIRSLGSAWQCSGKVLVVDDDETVRVVAKRMLENCGFEVVTANDGREGVETFRADASSFVAVLLDMTMPHMDGDEAFREIRRIRPDARVILSSGYNEQDATNRFAGKGLAGFIQKPYRSEQLLAKVREILDPKR